MGNTSFKAGDNKSALESYKEATAALNKLKKDDKEDSQVKTLLISLNGNMTMTLIKNGDWLAAKETASAVLALDAKNIKALYRRGCAYHKMDALDEAQSDLNKVLSLDDTNAAAKKELALVKKAAKDFEKKESAVFKSAGRSMFGGKDMYADKEKERLVKIRKEEERQSKLKDDWTQDKMARRHRGEEELDFEAYKKEREEKEAADKKAKEEEDKKKKKEAAPPRPAPTGKAPTPSKKKPAEDEDESDDEETRELIKGYKTTSDGRKTSYFNNELTDEAKALIGDIAPKPIGAPSETVSEVQQEFAPPPIAPTDNNKAGSAWNHAGTFEEKDMTSWVKAKMTSYLSDAKCGVEASGDGNSILNGSIHLQVNNVKSLTGDAEIIASRGKRRYLYDFSAELEWQAVVTAFPLSGGLGDSKDKIIKGTLKLSDISPDNEAEFSWVYKKAVPPELRERVKAATEKLLQTVNLQLVAFKGEYQKQ